MYDVIIIGGGPAGIFSALELTRAGMKVVILEKGRPIEKRNCPQAELQRCVRCKPCDIMCGWGGAGAFSDGKLTLTTEYGGWLDEYLPKPEVLKLIHYADKQYIKYGSPQKIYGDDFQDEIRQLKQKAAAADLQLIPARIRHLGTDNAYSILKAMSDDLAERSEIRTLTTVDEIVPGKNGEAHKVVLKNGEELLAKYIIAAPGREGAEWFREQANKLKLPMTNNSVDIGVRVELPADIFAPITDIVYESKLIYYTKTFDDQVRTFCMNPYGEVVTENVDGLITANGHSYANKKTQNTNFALLVSKNFTEPFNEPIAYGKSIARLANMLGNGVIVQRLGDLLDGRRSTPERIKRGLVEPTLKDATPGDLSLVLPYRHMTALIEMFKALDQVAPGTNSRHTLLYGVETKFYSSRLALSSELESQIPNFFAAGDGAGVTRGLAQASAAGVIVARAILKREGHQGEEI